VRDIAAKTGIDRKSIRRDLNRGRKLGVDTFTKLKNTSLDQAGDGAEVDGVARERVAPYVRNYSKFRPT